MCKICRKLDARQKKQPPLEKGKGKLYLIDVYRLILLMLGRGEVVCSFEKINAYFQTAWPGCLFDYLDRN